MGIRINCTRKTLSVDAETYPCRIGMAGFVQQNLGHEGDSKTPLGTYHIRFGLYRPDRLPAPRSRLTFWPLREDDGWCDAPHDPAYNRFVRLPYAASHEKLWRTDGVYDIILVISHNDSPPQKNAAGNGLGSAVFIHVAQIDDRQTQGCIALDPNVMVKLLARISTDTPIEITA